MNIILHSEEQLEFTDFEDPGMDIENRDPRAQYSALQMFATSLAICTYSMLHGYGEQIEADTAGLSMTVAWEYAEQPRRIARIDMQIKWPALPDSRLEAAQRVAAQCPLHETLAHPPQVGTTVTV